MSSSVAIITPSFERDFELCRTLNASVIEFLPNSVKHYIFVDRRDLRLFRPLAGERTIVASKEEIMPRDIIQIPGFNRWLSSSALVPVSGWLVQQIVKIATASILTEATLVMVDSDALFVRDVEPSVFATSEASRLYRCPGGITAQMKDHILWYDNACKLLNVATDTPPMTDYIGQVISWDRDLLGQMCRRIESVSEMTWHGALARTRAVAEYLLYGLFVEKVIGPTPRVWIDERSRCKTHWPITPLLDTDVSDFSGSLQDGDFALMINAHSGTSKETRSAAIAQATKGRLR